MNLCAAIGIAMCFVAVLIPAIQVLNDSRGRKR